MTCAFCDDCPFLDPNIPADLHEIHITIDQPDNPFVAFQDMCQFLGVKPVMLDLNGTMKDIMTTSRYRGREDDALRHAEWIASQLKLNGYNVIRIKIETTLTNPIAVRCQNDGYYESHIALNMKAEDKPALIELIDLFKEIGVHGIHVSNNVFKENVQMLTVRSYKGYADWHQNKVGVLMVSLHDNNYDVKKIIHEYCWYDSNLNHDERWTNGR